MKRHQVMLLFYNAVVKDRMHFLPVYLTLYDVSASIHLHNLTANVTFFVFST